MRKFTLGLLYFTATAIASLSHAVAAEAPETDKVAELKPAVSAYTRIAVAWFATKRCPVLTPEEQRIFDADVARNTVGLNKAIGAASGNMANGQKVLLGAQRQAEKYSVGKYQSCNQAVEKLVNAAMVETKALNESLTNGVPYDMPGSVKYE